MIVEYRDVPRALWRLGAPNALALVADQFLGIADTIVIGALGTASLAAISAATSVFIVFAIGLWAFPSAARIMGAQAIGAGDTARFGRVMRASILTPLGIAFATAILSLLAARPLMDVLLGAIPTREAAASYLILRSVSLIPIAISNQAIAAFSAAGEARLAPRALLVINVVHIPLLIVLALGVGTHLPLGLFGAGLSSLIAECAGAAFCIWQTARRPQYSIFAEASVDLRTAKAATLLGLPDFVMLVLLMAPEAITVAFLAPLGAVAVAAYRALTMVSDITWAVPGGFGDAIQIVIGQRLGAGDVAGARWFLQRSTRLAVLAGAGVALVFAIFAWPLSALVTLSPMLAGVAAAPLALHLMTLPLKGYAMALLAPIRAAGDTRFSMWQGIAGAIIVVAVIALATPAIGLYAVGTAWIIAWGVRALLSWLRVRGGDWERRSLGA